MSIAAGGGGGEEKKQKLPSFMMEIDIRQPVGTASYG